MSEKESPWDGSFESPEEWFEIITRHWPHYVDLTIDYSLSWSASRTSEFGEVIKHVDGDPPEGHVECAATTRTDTQSGSVSGAFVWARQSEADEVSEQDLEPEEFRMGLRDWGSSNPPRIDSAMLHHVSAVGSSNEITGSWAQTIYTGRVGGTEDEYDCSIDFETTGGTITATGYVSLFGILESGTGTWAKYLSSIGFEHPGLFPNIPLPTPTYTQVVAISGPPEGADIVFSASATLATPDTGGWHGSAAISWTATLST